jgi:hypothetical protein
MGNAMKGKMQRAFEQLLGSTGKISHAALSYPTVAVVAACDFRLEIENVYKRLGGILPSPPLNLRRWDMEFDGIAVELDEYLHFNRYRGLTLKSAIYECLPHFPLDAYKRFCSERGEKCLAAGGYGGKWSNISTQAQFGPPSPPRDLSGNGSPRWKQRAYYDFVKDASPLMIGVKVVRVALWDMLKVGDRTTTVEEMLARSAQRQGAPSASEANIASLVALIRERAAD